MEQSIELEITKKLLVDTNYDRHIRMGKYLVLKNFHYYFKFPKFLFSSPWINFGEHSTATVIYIENLKKDFVLFEHFNKYFLCLNSFKFSYDDYDGTVLYLTSKPNNFKYYDVKIHYIEDVIINQNVLDANEMSLTQLEQFVFEET
jgi:hypothetical protein